MPKTLMQSVVSELQKERQRLEAPRDSRPDRLREGLHVWKSTERCYCNSQNANHFGCGTQENCGRSTGAVGKDQGAKGCFNQCPQRTHNVPSRPCPRGKPERLNLLRHGAFATRSQFGQTIRKRLSA
jgi:hypothetical protein